MNNWNRMFKPIVVLGLICVIVTGALAATNSVTAPIIEEATRLAQEQARQIVAHAQAEAEHSRERIMRESQRELRKLAAKAAKKLALQADPFDQFLGLVEEDEENED